MKRDHRKHISELRENGVTILPEVYSPQQCAAYIDRFEAIVDRFAKERRPLGSECQVIENPFRHDPMLAQLIYLPDIEIIFKELLDENFVLINSNVINRKKRHESLPGGFTVGMDWHTDSRFLDGKRLEKGLSYIVITMFNDFSESNGGTQIVPGSIYRREKPEHEASYPHETLVGPAGTVAIIDTGLWHRGGPAGAADRWSMCSYYGPWFMKPYYQFPLMFDKAFADSLSPQLKRLFHFNSTPPVNEDERRNTVVS